MLEVIFWLSKDVAACSYPFEMLFIKDKFKPWLLIFWWVPCWIQFLLRLTIWQCLRWSQFRENDRSMRTLSLPRITFLSIFPLLLIGNSMVKVYGFTYWLFVALKNLDDLFTVSKKIHTESVRTNKFKESGRADKFIFW